MQLRDTFSICHLHDAITKKALQQSLMIVECADKTSYCAKGDKSEQRVHDINEPHEDFTPFYRQSYIPL